MRKNRDASEDAMTLETIETAVNRPDLPRAVELARAALNDGLQHPMLYNLRSYWWSNQGKFREALDDLRAALAIAPTDLLVRNAYGLLLGRLERWPEAFPVLRETIEMAPDYAVGQYSLGWALERTGELDEARDCFERAVSLDPGFVKPLVHLADFAQRRSDWETAKALANRALTLQPNEYVAQTILAIVALAQGDVDGAEALVTPLLARPAEAPLDASLARRVMGDVRHAQARYAQAFAAYKASNAMKYELYKGRYETQGTTATDYAAWLARYFETAEPAQWSAKRGNVPADGRDGARGHVFIVGFPRSGTTLLENVLASHPDVCTLEEKDTFGDLTHAFLVNDEGRDKLAAMKDSELEPHRAAYWNRVRRFGAEVSGKVFVDKYPLSSIKLPMVAKLFPEAKVLFALRDPRDVVLSCYRRNFAMNSSMFEFLEIGRAARFYDAVMNLCAIYQDRLGLGWHQIRNESLVEDFEGEARKACDFMGLEWNAQMNDFAEHAKSRTIRTPSSVQVVRGINRDGVGQWRHYAAEMAPAMPALARWVEEFGYPVA